MADIQLTCNSCGNVVTVSEFADPSSITCKQCGESLQKPIAPPSAEAMGSRPKLKSQKETKKRISPEHSEEDEQGGQWLILQDSRKNLPQETGSHLKHAIGSWVVFVVLGAASGAAKYLGVLDSYGLIEYGPYLILAFNLAIMLKAFKDNMFQGVLCLLVPGYSFYYRLMLCDDFYMRAVITGLTVGIAEDSVVFYSEHAANIFGTVTDWIQTGGGGGPQWHM
ncbi:MAG: hypothetical protein KAH23_06680 [Kiritimatiellae bacterium]|nr:hypothetical protein [Kiritimatiellia bacterium]